jgi:molybdopterin synthase sulfur carrier subunit
MATVRIPPVLRPKTGGQAEVEAAGSDVGEVLRSLTGEYPDTQAQLFEDGDSVVILPAMAGG